MTTSRIPLAIAFALVASCSITPASAQDTPSQPSPQLRDAMARRVQAADRNHDGVLDRAEAAAGTPRLFAHFDEVDADRDGRLSRDELRAAAAQAGQMMAAGWR